MLVTLPFKVADVDFRFLHDLVVDDTFLYFSVHEDSALGKKYGTKKSALVRQAIRTQSLPQVVLGPLLDTARGLALTKEFLYWTEIADTGQRTLMRAKLGLLPCDAAVCAEKIGKVTGAEGREGIQIVALNDLGVFVKQSGGEVTKFEAGGGGWQSKALVGLSGPNSSLARADQRVYWHSKGNFAELVDGFTVRQTPDVANKDFFLAGSCDGVTGFAVTDLTAELLPGFDSARSKPCSAALNDCAQPALQLIADSTDLYVARPAGEGVLRVSRNTGVGTKVTASLDGFDVVANDDAIFVSDMGNPNPPSQSRIMRIPKRKTP